MLKSHRFILHMKSSQPNTTHKLVSNVMIFALKLIMIYKWTITNKQINVIDNGFQCPPKREERVSKGGSCQQGMVRFELRGCLS